MEEIWTIQTIAVSVSIITLIVIACILQKILTEIRQLNKDNDVDKSLHLKIEMEKAKYKNMKAQNSILMTENAYIADQRNDLAIKLDQEKNK